MTVQCTSFAGVSCKPSQQQGEPRAHRHLGAEHASKCVYVHSRRYIRCALWRIHPVAAKALHWQMLVYCTGHVRAYQKVLMSMV
jgi:hypothetical protein